MRKSGIHVELRLDSILFPQHPFVNEGFVPQYVHSADLEISRWQISVALWMVERCEERIMFIGFVCLHEHVDCNLGKDGATLILFVRQIEFLILLWDNGCGEHGWDGEVLARKMR